MPLVIPHAMMCRVPLLCQQWRDVGDVPRQVPLLTEQLHTRRVIGLAPLANNYCPLCGLILLKILRYADIIKPDSRP